MPTQCSALIFHLRITRLTSSSASLHRDLSVGLCRPAHLVLQLRGLYCSTAYQRQSRMHAADYAPPGFFAAHPLVPGFQLRDRFIGLDMDLHADKLMAAYAYEAKPHVRNEVVKDGLNIRVQVHKQHIRDHDAHCARAHAAHTSLQLMPQCRLASMSCAICGSFSCRLMRAPDSSLPECSGACAVLSTARSCHHWLSCRCRDAQ